MDTTQYLFSILREIIPVCIRKAMMTKWNGIWSARGEKMREIRPEVEKWDIDNLLNRRDEVIIKTSIWPYLDHS